MVQIFENDTPIIRSELDNRILKLCHVSIFCGIREFLFHIEAVTCRPLPVDSKGLSVTPASCKATSSSYGTECRFHCAPGYMLEGPSIKTCTQSGDWSFTVNTYCKGTLYFTITRVPGVMSSANT